MKNKDKETAYNILELSRNLPKSQILGEFKNYKELIKINPDANVMTPNKYTSSSPVTRLVIPQEKRRSFESTKNQLYQLRKNESNTKKPFS